MYLIDANVFIEAKNKYYHMAFCPGFWEWLLKGNESSSLYSIRNVRDELRHGHDELTEWADLHKDFFLTVSDEATQRNLAQIAAYIAREQTESEMKTGAMDEFMRGADVWLIAKALSSGATIVTHEILNMECKRKFLIPNICQHFNVPCTDTFSLLHELNAQFVLAS